ncbi:MAG: 2-oxoglutarate oxidoreductase [Clostridiales Family XIII bacterium]|jgi:2-oxoglutarate ferredoxin oxidoreductase subunit beta|nr:2-oxoglutarate oxidoreductase [Clostridiales Family XIII bacterium]
MELVYKKPEAINANPFPYCPGCMHGTVTKLIAEVIDEFGLREKTIVVLPVGCGTLGVLLWNMDNICSAHGRAPAVATGIKRTHPEKFVFTYQGDGDLGAIGFSEIMYAANRGEKISVIFVNNSIYGMTGGQMAPTTLVGQRATTCQDGRDPEREGYPLKIAELIAQLTTPVYVARFAVNTPQNVRAAKEGIKKAFQNQMDGLGFSLVEILSNCPTNWGVSPMATLDFIKDQTMKEFPLGVFRDKTEEAADEK